jgi:hypothetical protein
MGQGHGEEDRTMKLGPVFREGIEIQIVEGHGFAAYFYLMILLAPVVFLALFLPSLDAEVWIGPAQLFKVSAVAALLLIVYFGLRVANQEFAPWRFAPLKRRLRDEKVSPTEIARDQLSILSLQILIFVLLASPFLVWAAAIARVPIASMLSVLLLIFLYALAYGVWGLAALALWERKIETRQVFVRGFFLGAMVLSAAFYLPLNPVAFLLSFLEEKEMAALVLWGRTWPAGAVHLTFHMLLLGSGLAIYRRALGRETYP